MREIRTSGSMSGDGKRSVAAWPKLPRPSSTLPKRARAHATACPELAKADAPSPSVLWTKVEPRSRGVRFFFDGHGVRLQDLILLGHVRRVHAASPDDSLDNLGIKSSGARVPVHVGKFAIQHFSFLVNAFRTLHDIEQRLAVR